jgi:hypothetical protein
LWTCRPAAVDLTDFAGFANPGFISALTVIDGIAFGMIASDATPGYDEPFAYDLATGTFLAISGVTGSNVPLSPASSGEWTPPTMAMIGVYLVVTHPGFAATSNKFGWFDLSTPSAPSWDAGDTATNALPSVPVAVAQFSGRAYYACGNTLTFSNALDPLTVAASSDVLTLGDTSPVTALAGLPLNTQLGGIVQSLIAFKGVVSLFQITGDKATNDLASNLLNVSTGTFAPNTIVSTPKGVAFVSPDGLRIIDSYAHVSDPIGAQGFGKTVPFIFAVTPSRMCAAYNTGVIRITAQDGNALGTPTSEFWYHMATDQWSGPHTFPSSLIVPWNNTFVKAPVDVTAKLFESKSFQTLTSIYTENGTDLTWGWQTALFPDTGSMDENFLNETLLRMQFPAGMDSFNIYALDENDSVISQASYTPGGSASIWGTFSWGTGVWGGALNSLAPRQIQWPAPIVFRVLSIYVNGNSIGSFKIGNLWMRYQQTGYLQAAQ